MAEDALKPDLLWELLRPPAKPLTPKEQKSRDRQEKKRLKAQKAHDKAVEKGAYCESDW